MVKIRVDNNKLYMIVGKSRIKLSSATIYHRPNAIYPYEIIAFIWDGFKNKRKEIHQKTFDGVPNVVFNKIYTTPTEEFKEKAYASGSKESPTSINWYINYYKCKE